MIKYVVYYVDDFGKKHMTFVKTLKEIKFYQKDSLKYLMRLFKNLQK